MKHTTVVVDELIDLEHLDLLAGEQFSLDVQEILFDSLFEIPQNCLLSPSKFWHCLLPFESLDDLNSRQFGIKIDVHHQVSLIDAYVIDSHDGRFDYWLNNWAAYFCRYLNWDLAALQLQTKN